MDQQTKPYEVKDDMSENHISCRSFNLTDSRTDEITDKVVEVMNKTKQYSTWDEFYFAELKPIAQTEHEYDYVNFVYGKLVAMSQADHMSRHKAANELYKLMEQLQEDTEED